ncbi:MAG: zinc-ribbon domain-containing protein [Clostridia bacterium]|nr:zinc-ribbon domain-containing protein [Clostridia bacterium]
MTTKQLFQGTMPFMLAKLLLGGATVLISIILLAILMGIGYLFGEGGLLVTFIIWVGAIGVVRFAIMHYLGYMVKAGHIAVIAEACKRGKLPKNMVDYGKKRVKERFATANVYFAVDKLVTGSVKQIQRGIDKAGNKLDFIPGMEAIAGLVKFFVNISLGYIDECCLGWTFYNPKQGAFQSAADGVVIYAQNWKVLLKDAAKTMAKTLLILLLIVLAAFVPVGLIFKLLNWSPLFAFLLACLIAWTVKFAFIDSYIMIQMMGSYMGVAPRTQLAFDLYGKLCKLSSSFKELFGKGQQENGGRTQYAGEPRPRPAYPQDGQHPARPASAYPQNGERPQQPRYVSPQERPVQRPLEKAVFCGSCGAKNEPGAKFCGSCGEQL